MGLLLHQGLIDHGCSSLALRPYLHNFCASKLMWPESSSTTVSPAVKAEAVDLPAIGPRFGLFPNNHTAVLLLTASLCGLGIAIPNIWTLTQAVCSKEIVGTVAGMQNFGGNVGGALAPAVAGFLVHSTGSFAASLAAGLGRVYRSDERWRRLLDLG